MSNQRFTIMNSNTTAKDTATSVHTTIHNNNNNNNTITLRNLTAYDMLEERINMLELFNLIDTSEIDKYKLCYDIERQQNLLQTLKDKVDILKQTK